MLGRRASKGYVREEVAGVDEGDTDTIVGDPIGRDALIRSIAREMLPYAPEQLLALAEREFAWCDAEATKAAKAKAAERKRLPAGDTRHKRR